MSILPRFAQLLQHQRADNRERVDDLRGLTGGITDVVADLRRNQPTVIDRLPDFLDLLALCGGGISILHKGNPATKIREAQRVLGLAERFYDGAAAKINLLASFRPSRQHL